MKWTEHPFTDPLSGEVVHLQVGVDRATTGVRLTALSLADVSPELDYAFCPTCQWGCRISGAWFMDVIAEAWAS